MVNIKNTTGKKISLTNLRQQYLSIASEVNLAVERVLDSGWYLIGKELSAFESEFARYIGVKQAIGVSSGTDALTLSLKALGLGKGDGVVLAANVYPTSFGVALSGVKLQLADVNSNTLNLDLENIKKAVNSRTKAIVVVHLYGNPCNLEPILKFAKSKKLYVIEDCAQATGAKYRGKKVGSLGDIGTFSFYPTKNLPAYGDGGMITTNSAKIAQKLKLLRMYGEKSRYESILLGHNSRLSEIQAAILRVHLKHVDSWNKKRQILSKIYQENLKGLDVELLGVEDNSENVYHLFCILSQKRDELSDFLKKNNIDVGIHYPVPIHQVPTFKNLNYKKGDFPLSEKASQTLLSLPLHPFLSEQDVKKVCQTIKRFLGVN